MEIHCEQLGQKIFSPVEQDFEMFYSHPPQHFLFKPVTEHQHKEKEKGGLLDG